MLAIGPADHAGEWAAGLRAAYSRCKHPPSPFIQTCLSLLHLQSRAPMPMPKAMATDTGTAAPPTQGGESVGAATSPDSCEYSAYVRMLGHVQDPGTPSTCEALSH